MLKYLIKYIIVILVSVVASKSVHAQNFRYILDFGTYIDNLEGSDPYSDTRTLLSVSLAPEVGVVWDEHHSIMVGTSLIQDIGSMDNDLDVDLLAYYRYKDTNTRISLGIFPRKYSIANYPLSYYRESYYHYSPTINGIMYQHIFDDMGFIEVFGDWYGLDNEKRIDEFLIAGATEFNFFNKLLNVGGSFLWTHYKNGDVLVDCGLLERVLYNVYFKTDFKSLVPIFEELSFSVGTLSSLENKRTDDPLVEGWVSAPALSLDLVVQWNGWGFKNSYYMGKGQMPSYGLYGGDNFYFGSPFYQSGNYNRTDIYWTWHKKFLTVKVDAGFHMASGQFATQQILTLQVNISEVFKKGKSYEYDRYSNTIPY